jgi:PAS domain S-box-containing protein
MTARETTARRAQEQALRDQMQLTRDLIDRNPNPVFLKDEERRFVEINRAYSNLTRITPEQAIGRTVFDLYPEKDALVYDQQDRELLARGEGENSVEVDVVLGDGRRHYFLMNKSVLRRADGTVRGMVCTLTDVTTLKEADAKVRDQMQLTRDLIRALPNPLFLKDEEFRFVHVNPAWEKVAACPAEKAIGKLIPEVYPPEYAEEFLAQDRALLAQGDGVQSIEVSIPGRKGPRQYILSKSLLRREDGSLRGMIGSMTDITRLKRVEAQLRDGEERMRFWLENIPIPIAIYDPEGGVQFLNSAFVAAFGWTMEEMRGKRMPFVPEHRKEQLTGVLHRLLTVGKDAFETERMTKDGRVLDIFISTGMARGADGEPRATMVSLMDVTERKRMERELSASREEALLAVQAKAAFLAAMSHEIRTPLNGVLGMAGLLEGTPLTPEQREYVETIQVSGDALLAVINDILDYSKIESGRMELEQAPLEPVRAIEESLEILGARARAKGLELIAETDDNLPAWALGDLARLRQVLVNLVSNAVKFTDAGEILVSARAPEPGLIEFAVRDTGIGIPPDRIGALFDAFSQVDVSTTRKYGGTGLGLAISRRLVEFMGGELRVESEPGRGSTFSFCVRAQPCAPSAVPKSALAAADVLRGRRLLVVDDNETNRRILAHQLERWGAAQVTEGSAAAALERLAADRAFDAALLDYHMPGMDGVMLARELRRRGLKLPIVLLSSSMYRRAEEAEAELFAAQLLKPIRQQHLQAAIAAAIAGERFEAGQARRAAPGEARLAERLPLRILVADDVEVNRRLTVALLRNFGYAADAVASGREAVAAAERYDLVLMDVQMPDVDGLEATRQIRANTARQRGARGPRIVALTASAMAGDRERCLDAGMDDYLAKPLQPQALRAALEQVGRRAARQAGRRRVARPARAIDWSRIESLRPFDPDGSMVAGAIAAFLADAPARIHAIRAAHAAGDAAGLASAAHALKGAAANIGAARLQELSQSIEALAHEGRSPDAAKAIGGLEKSLSVARTALAKGKASPGS